MADLEQGGGSRFTLQIDRAVAFGTRKRMVHVDANVRVAGLQRTVVLVRPQDEKDIDTWSQCGTDAAKLARDTRPPAVKLTVIDVEQGRRALLGHNFPFDNP